MLAGRDQHHDSLRHGGLAFTRRSRFVRSFDTELGRLEHVHAGADERGAGANSGASRSMRTDARASMVSSSIELSRVIESRDQFSAA